MTVRVRIRGIYATALTRLLREEGIAIVQPSTSIAERFSLGSETEGYDAAISTAADRLGVGVNGDRETVTAVREHLSTTALDTFAWDDEAPQEGVFACVVTDTRANGAIVDLGPREGYLPYDAAQGYIEEGDRYRVQVTESTPPWADDRPLVDTEFRVDGGGLVELVYEPGSPSGSSGANRRAGSGVADVTDFLSTDVPGNWHARPGERADDASFDALDSALAEAVERASDLEAALGATGDDEDAAGSGDDEGPCQLWTGPRTVWVRFGRIGRFGLDDARRAVTATMAGHHRIKAGAERASAAVDFVESVCGSAGETEVGDEASVDADDLDFPFDVTTRHFGPQEGETVAIRHGKPDGREILLGRGEVSAIDADGTLVLRREMRSGGTYDALGTERRAGDVAITRMKEGRWWYQTRYQGTDGDSRGTYVNVCTPVEIFPDAVQYVDLHVDVVKRPTGEVERVDDAELDAAVDDGAVGEELARKARSVATAIENAL